MTSAEFDPLAGAALRARQRVLRMVHSAGAGHPGGSLSCIDLLAVVMLQAGRFGPGKEPADWLVLGKGHAVPALYALLAELGVLSEEELLTYRQPGSRLQGHPDRRRLPAVQVTTGHLGQGLSVGVGLALAEQMSGSARHVFVVLGDADLQAGQTWEAAMAAHQFALSGLTLLIDANGLTQHGPVDRVMRIDPLDQRLAAFGWTTHDVDGHDRGSVRQAVDASMRAAGPAAVICRTTKGKGVGFMEDDPLWHSRGLSDDELAAAMVSLSERVP